MKNVRLVCMVEPKLKSALEAYSKKTGMPISEAIRRALAAYLKR